MFLVFIEHISKLDRILLKLVGSEKYFTTLPNRDTFYESDERGELIFNGGMRLIYNPLADSDLYDPYLTPVKEKCDG